MALPASAQTTGGSTGVTTGYNLVNQGVTLANLNLSIDTRGRVYSASDGVGVLKQQRYDKNSNTTQVWDGLSNKTLLTYGANNELTKLTWPTLTNGAFYRSFMYDAKGRPSSIVDENGATVTPGFDNADRLTSVTSSADSSLNEAFSYDNANRLLSASDKTGSTALPYDSTLKRLSSVLTTISALPAGSNQFTISYTYYPDGKRKTMTLTQGSVNYTWSYSWDAAGRLHSLVSPFGETATWTLDHAGRLSSQTTTTATSASIGSQYGYGVSGQAGDPSTAAAYLRSLTETINGASFWSYTLTH